MIIVRAPLRISFGGGGSDLPSYYERFGGFVISAAIDKHVYVGINKPFTNKYSIRYSSQELVLEPSQIKHPIIREAIKLHGVGPVEVVSLADIPAGTGLGSSGSFTVALLRAIYAYKRELVTTSSLAEEACHIEMNLLKEPVGKQLPHSAALLASRSTTVDKCRFRRSRLRTEPSMTSKITSCCFSLAIHAVPRPYSQTRSKNRRQATRT